MSAAGNSRALTFRGYETGAVDYIHKPVEPHILRSKVQVFLTLYRYQEQIKRQNEELEQRVAQRTEELKTACKAAEAASKAAEAASIAKGEFLANMSHEIRTPMTAILGFSEVLMNEEGIDLAPAQRRETISTIHRNGEYLIGIINDILDIAKIEAGKLQIEKIECSPSEVLHDVVSLIQVRATAKGLSIEVEIDGELPESIQSDPTRLRQILINLIGNAIKFTEVGKIRLVARLSNAKSESPSFQVDVIDTGIGLTEEQKLRLFQPFVQGDSSITRKFGVQASDSRLASVLPTHLEATFMSRVLRGKAAPSPSISRPDR